MARLSFDQEAWSRGITAMPLPPDVHRDIEDALREFIRAGGPHGSGGTSNRYQ